MRTAAVKNAKFLVIFGASKVFVPSRDLKSERLHRKPISKMNDVGKRETEQKTFEI
jgi:hypothetical protein